MVFLEETLVPIGVNLVFLLETTVFHSTTLGNHGFRRQNTSSHRENVVFLRENMVLYGFVWVSLGKNAAGKIFRFSSMKFVKGVMENFGEVQLCCCVM